MFTPVITHLFAGEAYARACTVKSMRRIVIWSKIMEAGPGLGWKGGPLTGRKGALGSFGTCVGRHLSEVMWEGECKGKPPKGMGVGKLL